MRRLPRIAGVPLTKESMSSLTTGLKDLARGRFANKLVKQERLRICNSCPLGGIKCEACGCFIKTKIALQNSICPMGKWSSGDSGVDSGEQQKTPE